MTVEVAQFINNLNPALPNGASDPITEGDNHIRLIKGAILATFPAIAGQVAATHADLSSLLGAATTGANGLNVVTQAATNNGTLAASTAQVQAAIGVAIAPLAPINSPGFTGTPTAPTATAGTATGQLATTAFAAALNIVGTAAATASATASASTATNAAASAAVSAGAVIWVTGNTYAVNARVISPSNGRVYMSLAAGVSNTDPASDTRWLLVTTNRVAVAITAATITAISGTHYVMTNAAQSILTLPASPVTGSIVQVTFANARTDNIIARNGSALLLDSAGNPLFEDMTVDVLNRSVILEYAYNAWRFYLDSTAVASAAVVVTVTQATDAATTAKAAATATTTTQTAINNKYRGALALDPATRPDSTANQVGDEYFSTTVNLLKRFNGSIWLAGDLNTANLAASTGAGLVGYLPAGAGAVATTLQDKIRRYVSVLDKGAIADGVTSCKPAVLAAKADGGNVYFPRVNNANTSYYLGFINPGDLDNSFILADRGVTLLIGNNQYASFKNITFDSDVSVYFQDVKASHVFTKTPLAIKKEFLPQPDYLVKRLRTALDATLPLQVYALGVTWPTGDAFVNQTVIRAVDVLNFPAGGDNVFRGAFVDIGPYETVSAYFDSKLTAGPIGLIVRGTLGFRVIFAGDDTGNFYTAYKGIGVAVTGNAADLPWAELGQGVYTSYAPSNSVWSVTRTNRDKAVLKLNGKALTLPFIQSCGDILQVGFVCFNTGAFSISGLTIERRTDAIVGSQILNEVRIFGDSTAETFPSSFDQYIKPILDMSYGVKLKTVTNYAVAGTLLYQAYNSMVTNGFGNSYHVVICSGTNDIQGQTDLASFKSSVSSIVSLIQASGRMPVFVLPWMFYTQAQTVGAVGQASVNYEKGAPYRMAIERICFAAGAIVVKTTEELPNPDPAYIGTPAPLLRDNIHQDAVAYQLYAKAICAAIASDYLSLPENVEHALPATSFINGAANSSAKFTIDKGGMVNIAGTVTLTTIADGTQIIVLPRYMRPTSDQNFTAVAFAAGGATLLGPAYLSYAQSTGVLSLYKAPATTALIIFSGVSYKAAQTV